MLRDFREKNAKQSDYVGDLSKVKLPDNSVADEPYYWTFNDPVLFTQYKKLETSSGGKSKKKRSYIKNKTLRRYGVKSNKSHKRKESINNIYLAVILPLF